MKDRKTRQDNLLYNWGFKCCCDICQEEEVNPDKQKVYQIYDQLQQEVRNLLGNQKNRDKIARLDIIKMEVMCHKKMYKLAKEKKVEGNLPL